jgi:hypothetical protein
MKKVLLALCFVVCLGGLSFADCIPGDIDCDGDVDKNDVLIIATNRNQPAVVCPECDLDGDGVITVLDARKAVLLCSFPKCVVN